MMTHIRNATMAMAERREARRLYNATVRLDAKILKDIGLTRDDWSRTATRIR